MDVSVWSAQQLARYLAEVSAFDSEALAVRGAVELAAETFDAEVGVLVRGDTVAASVGFSAGAIPLAELAGAVEGGGMLAVPGAGSCHTIRVSVEVEGQEWSLLLARAADPFSRDETSLLRAMGSVVSLSLGNLRTMTALRERQVLLERLSGIQRAISARAPLGEVFDAITIASSELIGDPVASLYLLDPAQPGSLVAASVHGDALAPLLHRSRLWVDRGVVGRSVADDELTVVEGYGGHPVADPRAAKAGIEASMAAPVHDGPRVVGCLVVGSRTAGRTYRPSERELLLSFAELASLAVTDARTVEALHQALGSANYRALHDSLTGLANRTSFLDRLGHAQAQRRGAEQAVAVLYVDIDDFKLVNDRHGHAAGDQVLVEVARRLGAAVRGGDTVARLGGDEFAVLLESASGRREAAAAAERVLRALSVPVDVHGAPVPAGASVGLAVDDAGGRSAEELLRRADIAMYRAKHAGKGRVATFDSGGDPPPFEPGRQDRLRTEYQHMMK